MDLQTFAGDPCHRLLSSIIYNNNLTTYRIHLSNPLSRGLDLDWTVVRVESVSTSNGQTSFLKSWSGAQIRSRGSVTILLPDSCSSRVNADRLKEWFEGMSFSKPKRPMLPTRTSSSVDGILQRTRSYYLFLILQTLSTIAQDGENRSSFSWPGCNTQISATLRLSGVHVLVTETK